MVNSLPQQLTQSRISRRSNPAPVGGWNTRDGRAVLPKLDAFLMDNWIPDVGDVKTREGHSVHAWVAEETPTFGNTAVNSVLAGTQIDLTHTMQSGSGRKLLVQVCGEGIGGAFPSSVVFEPAGVNLAFTNVTDGTNLGAVTQDSITISLWELNADTLVTAGTVTIRVTFTSNKNAGARSQMVLGLNQSAPELVAVGSVNAGTQLRNSMAVSAGTLQYEVCGSSISTTTISQVGDQDAELQEDIVSTLFMHNAAYNIEASAGTVDIDSDLDTSSDGVQVVASYKQLNTNGGTIETLMNYNGAGTERLLAATETEIFNATGAGLATSLASGFTSGIWDSANMNNLLGMVNGSDAPQEYNGTAVSAMTISGTGLTPSNLVGINVFKNRSYFWENNSARFWYSALDTLGGTLASFPLDLVSKKGGKLIAMENLSVSGTSGEEPTDLACFFMSTGEVIIYSGNDPGSNFALAGQYDIGDIIGTDRSIIRLDGDIVVITNQDYVSLTEAIKNSGRVRPSKLSGASQEATRLYKNNTGWQAFYHPERGLAWINVPVSSLVYHQHVKNLNTGAACRFKGFNARCWGLYAQDAYFGELNTGVIYKALDGLNDNGESIQATCEQAWWDLGAPFDKELTAVRPILSAQGTVDFGFGISADYRGAQVETITSDPGTGTPWGSPWGSPWSPATDIRDDFSVGGYYGQVFSPRLTVTFKNQEFAWLRTDFEFVPTI